MLYSFTFYMRNPGFHWMSHGMTTSAGPHWDAAVTLFGSSVDEAREQMPDDYIGWPIVKVDHPSGWPHFPAFPPSISTGGFVRTTSTGEQLGEFIRTTSTGEQYIG